MPEGHSIHRYARLHRRRLGGARITVTSPQGRFRAGAARLDGRRLETVDAAGKHLFYRWSGGETLHVHLGLFGKFTTFTSTVPQPTEGTRLALASDEATIYLAGPTICELIEPPEEAMVRARLGPDPLDRRADGATFVANLARRRIPIGAALLDQKVLAGIGNVYRSELLFLIGIAPHTPADTIDPSTAMTLWQRTVAELRRGEKTGRIVTTNPASFGAARDRDLEDDERLHVYKRDGVPCRRCGTEIRIGEIATRSIWWCPRCQA